MEFKVNIGDPKSGKTLKKVYSEDDTRFFIGKKIGVVIKGDLIGFPGYEFEITGGSDYCGFPMRKDVAGIARKKVLVTKGFGNKGAKRKGLRYRRTVAGNTVFSKTAQINLKVVKAGSKPLIEKKEEKKEEAKPKAKEAPKEKPKEAPKTEEKPETKKEEPKKEEKKEEKAPEKKESPKEKKEEPKKEKPAEKPKAEKKEEKKAEAKKEEPKKVPEKALKS